MFIGCGCNPDNYVAVFQFLKIEKVINKCLENFAEIFSLTGAGFSYSSYQHPRRHRGVNTNRYSPLAGALAVKRYAVILFKL